MVQDGESRGPYFPIFCGLNLYNGVYGSVVVKALRRLSDGPGIDPGGVTWDFFRCSFQKIHVP